MLLRYTSEDAKTCISERKERILKKFDDTAECVRGIHDEITRALDAAAAEHGELSRFIAITYNDDGPTPAHQEVSVSGPGMLAIDVAQSLVASRCLSADCLLLTELEKCCVASGGAGEANGDNMSSLDLADCYNGLPLGVRQSICFANAPDANSTVASWREWGVTTLTPLIQCKLVTTMVTSSPPRLSPRARRGRRGGPSLYDNDHQLEMGELEEGVEIHQQEAVCLGK